MVQNTQEVCSQHNGIVGHYTHEWWRIYASILADKWVK
jgi:hypothetical protein